MHRDFGLCPHSRELLRGCPDITQVDPSYCLVFDYGIEEQAYNWLFRQQKANSTFKLWKSFSPATFCSYINVGVKLPYTPKAETIMIGERLKSSAQNNSLDDFDIECANVKEYMSTCGFRYEHGECEYLSEIIKEAISLVNEACLCDEYERACFEIIREDMLKVASHHSKI